MVSCAHGHGFGQPPPSWCPLDAYRRADQGIVGARALSRSHAGTRPLAYLGAPHPVFYAGIDEQKAPPDRRVPSPALWRPRSWSRPWHPPCARPRGALPGTVPGARLVTAVGIGAAMVARPCPSLGTRGPCMSPHWAKLAVSAAHWHEHHGAAVSWGELRVVSCWDSFFQKAGMKAGIESVRAMIRVPKVTRCAAAAAESVGFWYNGRVKKFPQPSQFSVMCGT